MKQFEYTITNKKSGQIHQVRASAKNANIARLQIILSYGIDYVVSDMPSNIRPAHQVSGEIDCSDFPDRDMPWLIKEATLRSA